MADIIGIITDPIHPKLIKLLGEKGFKYDYLPDIKKKQLINIIGNYDFIIVRGRTILDQKTLRHAKKLKVIIRYGVGLDNVDVDYARKKGVSVYNTPRAFTEAVAELTVGLILGILRNIGEAHRSMKSGRWEKKRFYGYELYGKRVTILGFGRIGRRVADLLMPFNTKIVAYDILSIPQEYIRMGVIPASSLEDAVSDADIITIHMPLTKDTKHIINYSLMKKMRRRPFIINTARGGIIKQDDLKRALIEGLISGVALDVYEKEPPEDNELMSLDNVVFTPHIGAQTYEARERATEEVIDILERIFKNI